MDDLTTNNLLDKFINKGHLRLTVFLLDKFLLDKFINKGHLRLTVFLLDKFLLDKFLLDKFLLDKFINKDHLTLTVFYNYWRHLTPALGPISGFICTPSILAIIRYILILIRKYRHKKAKHRMPCLEHFGGAAAPHQTKQLMHNNLF